MIESVCSIEYQTLFLLPIVDLIGGALLLKKGALPFLYKTNREYMSNLIYLTNAGLQKVRQELDQLRSEERPRITAMIAEARDKGDLSENAEYDAAKEAQGLLEMRIAKLEMTIANARIIDESHIDTSTVKILNKVTIKNLATSKSITYTIVPENEASIKEHKLSFGTPIAKALLGHKKGDIVEVKVPSGMLKFEIEEISL